VVKSLIFDILTQPVAEFVGSGMPVSVKENSGGLFSEDNGFLDETFGNEWEIVR
jgi:hypothetical protein